MLSSPKEWSQGGSHWQKSVQATLPKGAYLACYIPCIFIGPLHCIPLFSPARMLAVIPLPCFLLPCSCIFSYQPITMHHLHMAKSLQGVSCNLTPQLIFSSCRHPACLHFLLLTVSTPQIADFSNLNNGTALSNLRFTSVVGIGSNFFFPQAWSSFSQWQVSVRIQSPSSREQTSLLFLLPFCHGCIVLNPNT